MISLIAQGHFAQPNDATLKLSRTRFVIAYFGTVICDTSVYVQVASYNARDSWDQYMTAQEQLMSRFISM